MLFIFPTRFFQTNNSVLEGLITDLLTATCDSILFNVLPTCASWFSAVLRCHLIFHNFQVLILLYLVFAE